MTTYQAESLDIAVIGAGHAGIEAALACARMGLRTALFTLTLDLVGNMPCNPSVGGTGKGHLVFELDALGGEMGKAANAVMLQSRMLNASKGPAVHSLRMQTDRVAYRAYMKRVLEQTEHLSLIQAEVVAIRVENGVLTGVETAFGAFYPATCAILCTGTSLKSRIFVGESISEAGADNTVPANRLSESLREAGIRLVRFKTGTPPRVHADSVDFSVMELQEGDADPVLFGSDAPAVNRLPCYVTYTNEETHRIIRENLHRSPLYSGEIVGTGPRYCPSIETKIMRFPDKERHQIFVEPMGLDTKEVYLQGLSSSLPEDVQKQLVHTIRGLEHCVFMRTAYAIEYDCCDPTQLDATLQFRTIRGLFGAGQFNGTSGYEEAAAQGLIAGINAALLCKGEPPLLLSRGESYIGTMIDDITVKGTDEPYRVMTSRSEYRLLLRQDNAKERLIGYGRHVGLVSEEAYADFLAEDTQKKQEIERLLREHLSPSEALDRLLTERGYAPAPSGIGKAEFLRRPFLSLEDLYALEDAPPALSPSVRRRVETELKYEGYIKRQLEEVHRFARMEEKRIPPDLDFASLGGLRLEARQKLSERRPETVGKASRIPGVSPADISVLLVALAQYGKGEQDENR
ncbi:MAG: tRNA uridine-5-carboxymethylaminomethyl(34) synthesis enzyme MnmG [Oscillospiraceae bacterium]|nr:tRNA uridine-5-carboxymethylaminomethyl(34) synthesis enzyme MnmG [Oscillospiraceae bacterium]